MLLSLAHLFTLQERKVQPLMRAPKTFRGVQKLTYRYHLQRVTRPKADVTHVLLQCAPVLRVFTEKRTLANIHYFDPTLVSYRGKFELSMKNGNLVKNRAFFSFRVPYKILDDQRLSVPFDAFIKFAKYLE